MSFENLYWIGLSISELLGIEHLFSGAIVLQGRMSDSSIETIYSYEEETKTRINYDDPTLFNDIDTFYIRSCEKILKQDKCAKLLWFMTPDLYFPTEIIKRSIYNAESGLVNSLNDKLKTRNLFKHLVPVIEPYIVFLYDLTIEQMKKLFPQYDRFVVQNEMSEGGGGTYLIQSKDDLDFMNKELSGTGLVSPFHENSIPINIHIIISKNETLICRPSVQIIRVNNHKLIYAGCDFNAIEYLEPALIKRTQTLANRIAKRLQQVGYVGVAGIDFLILENDRVVFVEINPRFQGSTSALNQCLKESGNISIQELHLFSFTNSLPTIEFDRINKRYFKKSILYGLASSSGDYWYFNTIANKLSSPDIRDTPYAKELLKIDYHTDGGDLIVSHQPNSQSFRLLMNSGALGLTFNGSLTLLPSFKKTQIINKINLNRILKQDLHAVACLKFDLLSCGIRISNDAKRKLLEMRKKGITIRDGIGGGLDIKLFADIYINV